MKRLYSLLFGLMLSVTVSAQSKSFDAFTRAFIKSYTSFHLPQLELSYVANLQHIGSAAQVKKQQHYFNSIILPDYRPGQWSTAQRTDYQLMKYEIEMNRERLALEAEWVKNPPATIPASGIIDIPNSKKWYAYYLKLWVGDDVTPDQIYQFGLAELKRVQGHIETLRKQTGLSENAFYKHIAEPEFFTTDVNEIQKGFEQTRTVIYSNMPKLFSNTDIVPLKIERGTNQALVQTPGYYDNNVFYYNFFDKLYSKRQYDWLFIHEAVPGHHYQSSVVAETKVSDLQNLFFYIGFAEGWGAYAEELGKDLGVYKTPYDELGKWEWDIVRSARVPMDVGLNYYGWTDEQALKFWKENIRGQDDIAAREIARMRRWPAQVVTYKYGALQILNWKAELQQKQGNKFDIKDFHNRVLSHGSLPIFLVKENVFKN